MAKEIITYKTSDPFLEGPPLDWEKLSSSEAGKISSGKREASIRNKYEDYSRNLEEKDSDEVLAAIDHWESIKSFLGNSCDFWGETKLPGFVRENQESGEEIKIYNWSDLEPSEKEQILVGIPQEKLFGEENGADAFFAKPVEKEEDYGDFYKKTLEAGGVLMKLGDVADAVIAKEKEKELEAKKKIEEERIAEENRRAEQARKAEEAQKDQEDQSTEEIEEAA